MVLVTTTINYIFALFPILSRNVLAIPFYASLGQHPQPTLFIESPRAAALPLPTTASISKRNIQSIVPPSYVTFSHIFTPTTPTPFLLTVYPSGSVARHQLDTITITQAEATVTVTAAPATTTTTVFVTSDYTSLVTTSYTEAPTDVNLSVTIPNPRSTQGSSSVLEQHSTPILWALPSQFSSIEDAFSIHHYAYGQSNVELIHSTGIGDRNGEQAEKNTVIKVSYPKSSYSPSHKPKGGADFYSTPLLLEDHPILPDKSLLLSRANNITLSYSVYFPEAFDFVKGGKLPGLYGGHEKSVQYLEGHHFH
jgi:hypothetical protein